MYVCTYEYLNTCNSTGSITFVDFLEVMTEVMGQTTKWGSMQTRLEGYVGFDTIQEQIRRKSLRRGFEFNVMVVGEWGTSLCTTNVCVHALGSSDGRCLFT